MTKTRRALSQAHLIAGFALTALLTHNAAIGAQATVNLGTAGNYVILQNQESALSRRPR